MRQVLFYIPLHALWDALPDIPIHGWGAMLFFAFMFCLWLAVRLARREGIPKEVLQDLAMWVFVSGIIGARAVFMIQYHTPIWDFYKLWDGGLVFYGGPMGALVGYILAYFLWLRKYHFSSWKIADVIAPCVALGLALGRVGCLLNGCCYGNVACMECPAIHFPLSAPAVYPMVKRGYQTEAGFTLETASPYSSSPITVVRSVDPGSPADQAGLKAKDKIKKVNGKDIYGFNDLSEYLGPYWPRGQSDLELTVARGAAGEQSEITIGPFRPMTMGLHPTQVYESISMVLLLFFLLSYYPFKKRDGSVMVFFMLGYGVHRFLDEMLRTDTEPVAFNMTLSQNISIIVLLAGLILALVVWRRRPHLASRAA